MSDAGATKKWGPQAGRGMPRKPAFPQKNNAAATKKFAGRCDELEGHIFDCGQPKHADLYNTTMEEVINHIRLNFKEGELVVRTIVSGNTVTIKKPVKPLNGDETDLEIWRAKIKNYVIKESNYEMALQRAYGLILGQCTQNMLANLKALNEFEQFDEDADMLALLKGVKSLVFNFEVTKSLPDALVMALKNFYKLYHPKTMGDSEFLRIYKSHYDVIEQSGGRIGNHPGMLAVQFLKMKVDVSEPAEIAANLEEASNRAEEEFLACHFLRMLNWERHGSLLMHLENQFTLGVDSYPKTLTEAYNLAIKWKATPLRQGESSQPEEGVTLATDVVKDKKGDLSKIKCFNCNKFGHYRSDCPDPKKDGGIKPPESVNTTTTVPASDLSAVTGVTGKPADDDTMKSVTNLNTVVVDGSEFTFLQSSRKSMIPKTWLLLDNQSTCGVISNKDMLRDIVDCDPAVMHSQGGADMLTKKGMLGDIECFYFEKGIANIVSLAKISEKYRVTFDSTNGNCFIVHIGGKKKIRFEQSPEGLYYHDTAASGHATFTMLVGSRELTFVDTVSENMEGFSQRQIAGAKKARDAYKTLGFPSMKDFISMVRDNLIKNCPITTDDIKNAHKIYGPDIASLKGKTVRRTPPAVRSDYIHVPRSIFDKNKRIILAGDIMYVAGVKFLLTVSRGINLITSEYLPNRTKGNLQESLSRAIRIYQNRGFHVTTALADQEFDPLRGLLGATDMNAAAAAEHVAEIERKIRLVKERFRALKSTLPYKLVPGRVLVEAISFCVTWLNAFPTKTGVSKVFSPRTIMTNTTLDFKKHCAIPFGSYCQVFQDNSPSNTPKERTVAAICMGPTGNAQGSYKYYALATKQKIVRPQATPLPMTDEIIAWVEKIAAQQNMPENIIFTTNRGEIVELDDNYVEDVDSLTVDESDYFPTALAQECDIESTTNETGVLPVTPADPAYNWSVPTDEVRHLIEHDDNDIASIASSNSSRLVGWADHVAAQHEQEVANQQDQFDYSSNDEDYVQNAESSSSSSSDVSGGDDSSIGSDSPGRYPTRSTRNANPHYKPTRGFHAALTSIMRSEACRMAGVNPNNIESPTAANAISSYFSYATFMNDETTSMPDNVLNEALPVVAHKVMLHMALKRGLKEYGIRGEKAVSTELMQIHMQNTFKPAHYADLTQVQRRKALESLLFLEEKRTGNIKGRMCADGSKQRDDFAKGEATSPTVTTDAVIITSAIDAHEGRDVAVIDLPGAFLHAEMDDVVHMVMRGRLAELMAETAPELYRKYITYGKNGDAILYVTLQKALYGCLKSALLFYRKLVGEIVEKGFVLNPYDPCVANKIINGKQMTITWHVDDLKISHVDATKVTAVIEWFKTIYGNVRVSRGKVHDYLGMNLDFSDNGKLKISMVPFLKKIIEDFPERITGSAATPATDRLFDVRDDSERILLEEERARAFHHAVAQFLFATIRYRRDVATTVAFLCTRVREPDEDDWGKLKRLLKYTRGTLYLPLTLEVDDLRLISWWVDASFAIHPDCKGHTGAMMSLGKGAVSAMSKKQKINTKSSTESEIVGVDDASTQILWNNYFIAAQGYTIDETEVFQDNISSSYLLVNGRESSSKRTKHMNVRYFFAKDRIASGEMKIKHCPTKQMLADPLTKPLQGSEFREFRSKMMNVDPTIPDWEMSWDRGETFAKSADLRPQECVGLPGILREPTHKVRRATRGSAVPVAE